MKFGSAEKKFGAGGRYLITRQLRDTASACYIAIHCQLLKPAALWKMQTPSSIDHKSREKRKHADDEAPPAGPQKRSRAEKKRAPKLPEQRWHNYAQPKHIGGSQGDLAGFGEADRNATTPAEAPRSETKDQSEQDNPGGAEEDDQQGVEQNMPKKQKKKKKKKRSGRTKRVVEQARRVQDGRAPNHDPPAMRRSHEDIQRKEDKGAKDKTAETAKWLTRQDQRSDAEDGEDTKTLTLPRQSFSLSKPSAGRYLDHDPIFVRDIDGKHFLISANSREVQVLSLQTSSVVRTHAPPAGVSVVCYCADADDINLVDIAYSDHTVWNWDWTNDNSVAKRRFTASGTVIAIASTPSAHDKDSALFYVGKLGRRNAISNDNLLLHVTKQRLESIQVLGEAHYVVARGPSALVLGMKKEGEAKLSDYIWIELPLNKSSTCLDARLLLSTQPSKKQAPQRRPGLSLALGNTNGQIQLFNDVSSGFNQAGQQGSSPAPRILHWHRDAVSSVKFSRDANYLISGGKETVLVLWQLETGKKQFLPHLNSEIRRVVVNLEGDRYALQMGDNSTMVLSTSELKPVANFAGLQIAPPPTGTLALLAQLPTVAVMHPKYSNRLMITVPSTLPSSSKDTPSRPFLQSFDVRTARHITRQALTRNNATDFNLGPNRTPIVPPDVKFLAISPSGQWLATVDEWMPPASDMKRLARPYRPPRFRDARLKRRQIFLKIWRWDEGDRMWSLHTRIDKPHAHADNGWRYVTGCGKVLALVADPASDGFATVGEDCRLRIWKPRKSKRREDSQRVKDKEDVAVQLEWTCTRTTLLAQDWVDFRVKDERVDLDVWEPFAGPSYTCMAYSPDGSLLAVSQRSHNIRDQPVVEFIDVSTGKLQHAKPGLCDHAITALGFVLERYLIVVSKPAAYVWDLFDDTLKLRIPLSSDVREREPGSVETERDPMLAVDERDGTLALATRRQNASAARVVVYSPTYKGCLYEEEFGTEIEAIVAGKGAKGYTLIFADATTRTLQPAGIQHAARLLPPNSRTPLTPPPSSPLRAVEAAGEQARDLVEVADMMVSATEPAPTQDRVARVVMDEEDDRAVVRPEQLATVFETVAQTSVKDMFQAVVGLYARKPSLGKALAEVEVGA